MLISNVVKRLKRMNKKKLNAALFFLLTVSNIKYVNFLAVLLGIKKIQALTPLIKIQGLYLTASPYYISFLSPTETLYHSFILSVMKFQW